MEKTQKYYRGFIGISVVFLAGSLIIWSKLHFFINADLDQAAFNSLSCWEKVLFSCGFLSLIVTNLLKSLLTEVINTTSYLQYQIDELNKKLSEEK